MDYLEDIDLSDEFKNKVEKTFKRLKKKRPKNLDKVFHSAHDEAFENIDCLSCANCCKTTSPIFRDIDVSRIAKKLKTTTKEFESEYLRKDEDGDWVLKSAPCTFLNHDNTCFIYDVRPQACKDYPHTNRKRMVQVLDVTIKNLEICPAVSKTVAKVLNEYE